MEPTCHYNKRLSNGCCLDYIRRGKEEGAQLVCGGPLDDPKGLSFRVINESSVIINNLN